MADPRDEYTGNHPLTDFEAPAEVRAICMGFAGAEEKWAWGSPTWRVNNRIFAQFSGSEERLELWVPAPPGAQEVLIQAKPARFFRPRYVGHKGWVGIRVDGEGIDWDEVAGVIADAYALVCEATAKKRPRRSS